MIKTKLKIFFRTIIAVSMLLNNCVIWAASSTNTASSVALDKVIAKVNTDIITQKELSQRIILLQRYMGSEAPNQVELCQKALDNLIDTTLQLQLATRNGITVSDKDIDRAIADIAKGNNLTIDKLKEILPKQEGISYTEFRHRLHEQRILNIVQQEFLARTINVSEKEIDEVLRNPPRISSEQAQYHVVDVLFKTDGMTKGQIDTIKNVANKVSIRLQKPKANLDVIIQETHVKFKEQAIVSEDLGWRMVNELPDLFAKEIVNMQINQVVGPIDAPNGLHLLKLLDVSGVSVANLTKDQAAEIVFQRKLKEKLEPWLKELREKAYIEITEKSLSK